MRRAADSSLGTSRIRLVLLVAGGVCLQLCSAAALKVATNVQNPWTLTVAIFLALVLALNIGRFVLWNAIHERYPISVSYPASALFFPLVVMLALLMGEAVTLPQIGGAALVGLGILMLMSCDAGQTEEVSQ